MKITIDINTDNSAFEDRDEEINRILVRVVSSIKNGRVGGSIIDINGNKVGRYEVDGE